MKVVITGGAGFIGSRLAEMLHDAVSELICVDTFTETIHGKISDNSPQFYTSVIKKSYGDIDRLQDVYSSADVVFLLAAETGMGASQYKNTLYCDTNILQTARVLDFLRKCNSTAHLILPSSCRIYGEGTYVCDVHGDFIPKGRDLSDLSMGSWQVKCPTCSRDSVFVSNQFGQSFSASSTYAVTKFAQESLVSTNASTATYDATILRLQNVYGPGQSFNNAYTGLVSIFSQQISNNLPLELYEQGYPTRDFVYIDDVCRALLATMNNRAISKGKVYDIGSGIQTSISHVAETLRKISQIDVPITKSVRFRYGDILNGCANYSIMHNDLGWSPTVSLETGLDIYWNWLMKQGQIVDHSQHCNDELSHNNILIDPRLKK